MRTAYKGHGERSGRVVIPDKLAAALQQSSVFNAPNGLANVWQMCVVLGCHILSLAGNWQAWARASRKRVQILWNPAPYGPVTLAEG